MNLRPRKTSPPKPAAPKRSTTAAKTPKPAAPKTSRTPAKTAKNTATKTTTTTSTKKTVADPPKPNSPPPPPLDSNIPGNEYLQKAVLSVQELEPLGINKSELIKLAENGISTIEAVVVAPLKTIVDIVGERVGAQIYEKAKSLIPTGFKPATEVHLKRADLIFIETGSREVNRILGGGIETGSLTEVFGEAGSGKTQLCHTLAVTCQLPIEQGGAEGKCIWFDTEGTFRPERLVAIAEARNLDVETCLENVAYVRVQNTDHQLSLLKPARAMIIESRYALVIVDSIINHYRTDFNVEEEDYMYTRQKHLKTFLTGLSNLAKEFGVAILMTNQMVPSIHNPNQLIPAGGNILAHASTTRLYFEKKNERRYCSLHNSPNLAEATVEFKIEKNGIADVE